MEDQMSGFFSKENWHRFGWVIIGGVLAWASQQVISKIMGPSHVVLDTAASKIPVQVTVNSSAASTAEITKALEHLAASMDALRKENPEVQAQFNKLNRQLSQIAPQSHRTPPPAMEGLPTSADDTLSLSEGAAALQRAIDAANRAAEKPADPPQFTFPKIRQGYTQTSFIGATNIMCPHKAVKPNEQFEIGFTFNTKNETKDLSPFFISIDQEKDKTHADRIFGNTWPIREGENMQTLQAPSSPGKYEVTFGYYKVSELNVKFPNFYARTCSLNVTL